MAVALRNYVNREIPVTESLNSRQVANNGGGFSYQVSDDIRLQRFLILGTDGGTFYVSEKDLTKENVDFIRRMISESEDKVRQIAVEISDSGRAYRNDAAVFVMALLLCEGKDKPATRQAISKVCRTASHVYQLAEFIDKLGGWGEAKKKAIANWFTSRSPDNLAYQAVKYRQRNGWTLRDLMRLSHPEGVDTRVGTFILKGENPSLVEGDIIDGFLLMQKTGDIDNVLNTLSMYPSLPWETIPTQFLNDLKVWKKLLENGQLRGQALIRQITRLSKLGAFDDLGFAREYATLLTDQGMIKKTRLHPMQYLNAYVVHSSGQAISRGLGFDRRKPWRTSSIIQDALDDGFGLSFGNIEPSNKRLMISVDVSSSMSYCPAGSSNFSCAQAAGAMALITARVEPYYTVNGFASGLTNLNLTARDSIESAFRKVQKSNFGSTNPSAPIKQALQDGMGIDTFIVITDNEVNCGSHPSMALKEYRRRTGIPAKMVVMGMAANNFTIADPNDSHMLDVVGFDTATPRVVSDFVAGRI